MLTFGAGGAILHERPKRGPCESKQSFKKIQKNLKKVLDKAKQLWYSKQAVAPMDGAPSTLKIEQCKNSLCKNKHQRKGFLKVRNDYKNSFES